MDCRPRRPHAPCSGGNPAGDGRHTELRRRAAPPTAYLARINGAARARSDAYFEGGYWLMLVDLVWALAVAGLLLWLRHFGAHARLGGGAHP